MKKLLFSTLFLFSVYLAEAQVRFGFKAAPNISFNRIEADTDNTQFDTDGVGLRFQLGPIFDIEFKENHYFSTGLIFTSKRSAFVADSLGATYDEDYSPQYLQVPITLKLFTEEIGLDKRIYFQFGGTVDFKTNNEGEEENIVQSFRFIDLNSLLAIGLEYGIGINTKIFGGIIYQRGLLNTIKENNYDDSFNLRNDFVGLEIGIIF
ncbi:Outer membrane protein beta-barrel domain-containing protein [Marivirga sericea]|uniref:Outer membrane protein beta-barrel domain-containing protein n=1 Tax=Marivirga sericea TaxID=1028 RepID=A0A1X7KRL6_9BACT|nr:outer membrane beta-barrel protein [Marivirga sericea]SMG43800.1 Outer membrane protein beta-barrel domain-containing protein [Marivirga sericea]